MCIWTMIDTNKVKINLLKSVSFHTSLGYKTIREDKQVFLLF